MTDREEAMKAQGWAVVGPDGLVISTLRQFDFDAMDALCDFHGVRKPWSWWTAHGYRCVPVTIEWRE